MVGSLLPHCKHRCRLWGVALAHDLLWPIISVGLPTHHGVGLSDKRPRGIGRGRPIGIGRGAPIGVGRRRPVGIRLAKPPLLLAGWLHQPEGRLAVWIGCCGGCRGYAHRVQARSGTKPQLLLAGRLHQAEGGLERLRLLLVLVKGWRARGSEASRLLLRCAGNGSAGMLGLDSPAGSQQVAVGLVGVVEGSEGREAGSGGKAAGHRGCAAVSSASGSADAVGPLVHALSLSNAVANHGVQVLRPGSGTAVHISGSLRGDRRLLCNCFLAIGLGRARREHRIHGDLDGG
mmetsp:Transcript_50849/g.134348  ORF Transcript_50849/g.134348 Transcript_50849/m.134348 type:complete len:289 (-) Transcript_50849:141-1007(-)